MQQTNIILVEGTEDWRAALAYIKDELGTGRHELEMPWEEKEHFFKAADRYNTAHGGGIIINVVDQRQPGGRRVNVIVRDHEWIDFDFKTYEDRGDIRAAIEALGEGQSVEFPANDVLVQYIRNIASAHIYKLRVERTAEGCRVTRGGGGESISIRQAIYNACARVVETGEDEFIPNHVTSIAYVRQVAATYEHTVHVRAAPGGCAIKAPGRAALSAREVIFEACDRAAAAGSVYIDTENISLNYLRVTVSQYNTQAKSPISVEKRPEGFFLTSSYAVMGAINDCALDYHENAAVRPETRERLKTMFQAILNNFKTE